MIDALQLATIIIKGTKMDETKEIKEVLDGMFGIIEHFTTTFKSGFSFWKVFQLYNIIPDAFTVATEAPMAVGEAMEIKPEQRDQLVDIYGTKLLNIFRSTNNNTNKFGITNTITLISAVAEMTETAYTAIRSGLSLTTLSYLPSEIAHAIAAAKSVPVAICEMQDLTNEEIIKIARYLVDTVIMMIKTMR